MINQSTQKLIQQYQAWYQSLQPKAGVPTIHVDEVASAVASFYEKIRGVIDWREEHLLRKTAIARVLKRRLFIRKNEEELAESLVLELIRSGHFPNDQIEEIKIEEAKKTLNKYLFILEKSPSGTEEKLKVQLYDWLLNISACEIEEILAPPLREKALTDYMVNLMKERIEMIGDKIIWQKIPQEEIEKQIYIAVQKALFKLDTPTLSYYLLRKRYSNWSDLPESQLKEIAENIYLIWENLEKDLKHPLAEKFYQICERYDTSYLILGDIISKNPNQAYENWKNPEFLEREIKEAYQKRLVKLKGRLFRAAIYSTISIFVTKILLALSIEVPFEKYILGHFNYQALALNILIPPILMLFLILTIRPPKKENLNRVIMEVMKIVHKTEKKDVYPIKLKRKRGFIFNFIISGFYFLTFLVSFGIIILGLMKLNFSILSMAIFLLFFCLIFFAGIKIRERAKELTVLPEEAGFLTFLIDTFSLPFLRVGKWLSLKLVRYNIILILITILIDLPFQLFTEFLEHWRTFLKEKKEEIH